MKIGLIGFYPTPKPFWKDYDHQSEREETNIQKYPVGIWIPAIMLNVFNIVPHFTKYNTNNNKKIDNENPIMPKGDAQCTKNCGVATELFERKCIAPRDSIFMSLFCMGHRG